MATLHAIDESVKASAEAPSFADDLLVAIHADTLSGRAVPPCPICGEPRVHGLGCRIARELGRFSVRLTSLQAFDPDDAGEFVEPTEADRAWAARLNEGWHASEPSPFERSLWDATTPDDVMEAEAGYHELARRAAEAEEQARIEAGVFAW